MGLPVVEVQIQGNRRVDVDAIRSVLRTRAGVVLETDMVADDIRAIYELGFFRDVGRVRVGAAQWSGRCLSSRREPDHSPRHHYR